MRDLRARVWDRCAGRCERCGIPLEASWALHHRKLKSRGGKDDITNLIALHHHCHNLGTDSVHLKPEAATRAGLIVASWDDPATIPVLLFDEGPVLLTGEGGYGREITDGG